MAAYARWTEPKPLPRLEGCDLWMSPEDWVALKAGADLAQMGWPDSLVTRLADTLGCDCGRSGPLFSVRVYVEGEHR